MKRLIICADGTWNTPEQKDGGRGAPTNVSTLAKSVQAQDAKGVQQVVYYHEGVGENGGFWDHLSGGAFGVGISRNIRDLYRFLCLNYAPGDELWLFGFSRGAYTARSLAGMVRNVGLLKRENLSMIGDAYDLYRDRTGASSPDSEAAKKFRAAYSWPDFRIRFIGVWDTVGALGVPVTPLRFWNKQLYEFHDVQLSRSVDFAYQALAIDEHRKPYSPSVWNKHPEAPATQVLEQAWFPGVHCNVGGGYADPGLADCALNWMWDRATRAGLALDAPPRKGNPDGVLRDSMTLFFRLLGAKARTPGAEKKGAEGVSRTARDRKDYHPRNLEHFLKENPPTYEP